MSEKLTDIFGIDTFDDATMRERLPESIYKALKKTIENGEELDAQVAEVVANAMKEWAIERGATHYSHWFQPMTGFTAEKHDSFITPAAGGKITMEFSGKELIKGEPDASSFPSGGLRATFEARGYTAWDCTSPAFLREDAAGVTLCIPTAFCSYTGEALDKKTPLLRSMEVIDRAAVRMLHLLGKTEVKSVKCCVGAEQEYFLVDRQQYLKRDDLIYTGHTLFGANPPKGQELDDHYFGCIKERVASYMKEINTELWKLGILAKTQHNEAAPAQHELVPMYTTANIACDHNQLVMEVMKKVAIRHGMTCLLHEKPFAGISGSGKHNNWSLVTDTGENLFKPGKKPHENPQFLLFLAAVLKAIDRHADLLRLSAATPGNDYRLGETEAPPAIISIFLGEQLEDILMQLVETGEATSSKKGGRINVGVHSLPEIKKDVTDRNRTSPVAFTGNKFEFRSVGASMSIADTNTVLNTILAEALNEMADELEKAEDRDAALQQLIARTVREHQRIIFNGNGYSQEWREEAKARGLQEYPTMVDAIPAWTTGKAIKLFEKEGVLSRVELRSRSEIYYEIYTKEVNIEAGTMIKMASEQFIPAAIHYSTILANNINAILQAMPDADVSVQKELLAKTNGYMKEAAQALQALKDTVAEAKKQAPGETRARYYCSEVMPAMKKLRKPVDMLETIVDRELWPIPTYGELLYEL